MIKIERFTGIADRRRIEKGTVILQEGDACNELHIIVLGSVGVYSEYGKPRQKLVAVLTTGDYFGEQGMLLGLPAPATYISLMNTTVAAVSAETAGAVFGASPGAALSFAASLCERLSRRDASLEQLYSGYPPVLMPRRVSQPELALQAQPEREIPPATQRTPKQAANPLPVDPPVAAQPEAKPDTAPREAGKPAQKTHVRPAAAAPASQHPESVPAAAPAKEEKAAAPKPAVRAGSAKPELTDIFPPGHGSYKLEVPFGDNPYLMDKTFTCPQCGRTFKSQVVRPSRLVSIGTDPDRRVRYSGIEPLYYDIVVCPDCRYSAIADSFESALKRRAIVLEKLQPIMEQLDGIFDRPPGADSVFAAHFTALACAEICFQPGALMHCRLWHKLSRIYSDAGDAGMEAQAVKTAYESYMSAYQKINISARQNQSLCVIIAELALKLGDYITARNFFFKAKTDREGTPILRRHAEDRIEDIKEAMQNG